MVLIRMYGNSLLPPSTPIQNLQHSLCLDASATLHSDEDVIPQQSSPNGCPGL